MYGIKLYLKMELLSIIAFYRQLQSINRLEVLNI
jgi:hypothetical protein